MHSFMASSSKTHKDYKPLEKEEEGDWLELGLGFGSASTKSVHGSNSASASASASSSSSSFPLQTAQPKVGLGFDNVNVRDQGSVVPPGNYPLDHHNLYQHHDMPPSSLSLFTTQSLSSWPWLIDSGSFLGIHNRAVPVPNHTHHFPSRPQAGLWFTLRSSINRDGEELPQLPRAYIRVKDENVTVFMVKTYLVRKLGLSNEAEIWPLDAKLWGFHEELTSRAFPSMVDVSCMGQKLLHSQTLKHVRDSIWLPRLVESVNSRTAMIENSNEISINHLMSLHYGRRCHLN